MSWEARVAQRQAKAAEPPQDSASRQLNTKEATSRGTGYYPLPKRKPIASRTNHSSLTKKKSKEHAEDSQLSLEEKKKLREAKRKERKERIRKSTTASFTRDKPSSEARRRKASTLSASLTRDAVSDAKDKLEPDTSLLETRSSSRKVIEKSKRSHKNPSNRSASHPT